MKTFVIQAIVDNNYTLPAYDFCYTVIDAIRFMNWFHNGKLYDYCLVNDVKDLSTYGDKDYIPIGSVEFVLDWYKQCGIPTIIPLNIPEELWSLCHRPIKIDYCSNVNGHWMMKDIYEIKHSANGEVYFHGDGGNDKKWFLSKWVDNVESEWRIFVYNKKIIGMRNYSGDPFVTPDKDYIQDIVDKYDKQVYTLDAMVYKDKIAPYKYMTDILELHDFFSCGLYGFDNYGSMIKMHLTAHREILDKIHT